MPIPALNEHGLLPQGIHDCFLEEIQTRFGAFQGSDRRPRLWARFLEFYRELKSCAMVTSILVNGSSVTAKPDPNDIDLILLLPATHVGKTCRPPTTTCSQPGASNAVTDSTFWRQRPAPSSTGAISTSSNGSAFSPAKPKVSCD